MFHKVQAALGGQAVYAGRNSSRNSQRRAVPGTRMAPSQPAGHAAAARTTPSHRDGHATTSKEKTMTAQATVRGFADAPTTHAKLLAWVAEVAELTTPERIVW